MKSTEHRNNLKPSIIYSFRQIYFQIYLNAKLELLRWFLFVCFNLWFWVQFFLLAYNSKIFHTQWIWFAVVTIPLKFLFKRGLLLIIWNNIQAYKQHWKTKWVSMKDWLEISPIELRNWHKDNSEGGKIFI